MAPARSAAQAPRMAKQVNVLRQNRASIAWPVADLSAPAKRRRPPRSRRDAVASFDPSAAQNNDMAVAWGSGPRVICENLVLGEWYDYCGRPIKHSMAVPVKLVWVPSKHVAIVAAQDIPAGTVVCRERDANEERCTVEEAREKLKNKSPEERQILLGHSWG